MEHRFFLVHQMDKVKVAAAIASGVERTLVFCAPSAAPTVSSSSSSVRACGPRAIHGDLRQGARERALADFTTGKVPVLVATDVAARGIHVDGVDVVVHYDPRRGPQGVPPPLRAARHAPGRAGVASR